MAEKNVEKTYTDVTTGKFAPGNPGGGRPPGRKNDLTIYREALEKLAEINDKSPEEIDTEIVAKGIQQAQKGNYSFYKDYMDRSRGPIANRNENINFHADIHKLQDEEKERLDDLIK